VTPERLFLSKALADDIRRHAAASYPNECCGLLVGEGDRDITISEVVPVPNVAGTPRNRFDIDPQQQFELLRALRGTSRRIVGHFHSHPDGAPKPSSHDRAMAYDFTAVWVIAAATAAGTDEMRAYVCPGETADFVEIPIS